MKKLMLLAALWAASAEAETYRCNVDGKTVYSQTQCSHGAERVRMAPAPTDSLDNPEAAERHRLKLEQEQARQEAERQELERQAEAARQRTLEDERLRHDRAMESNLEVVKSKLDRIETDTKQLRREQAEQGSALDQARSEQARSKALGTTCRPNGGGTLYCD